MNIIQSNMVHNLMVQLQLLLAVWLCINYYETIWICICITISFEFTVNPFYINISSMWNTPNWCISTCWWYGENNWQLQYASFISARASKTQKKTIQKQQKSNKTSHQTRITVQLWSRHTAKTKGLAHSAWEIRNTYMICQHIML